MYIPEYFDIREWFPEKFFKKYYPIYGKRLWMVIDKEVLMTGDGLRSHYGAFLMNTWWSPRLIQQYGYHQWRGYRNPTCRIGATLSQHRFGRAGDLVPLYVSADEIRNDAIAFPDSPYFKYITCIEEPSPGKPMGWFHYDKRNWNRGTSGILWIKRR